MRDLIKFKTIVFPHLSDIEYDIWYMMMNAFVFTEECLF